VGEDTHECADGACDDCGVTLPPDALSDSDGTLLSARRDARTDTAIFDRISAAAEALQGSRAGAGGAKHATRYARAKRGVECDG
jgi:hypothetical protein